MTIPAEQGHGDIGTKEGCRFAHGNFQYLLLVLDAWKGSAEGNQLAPS
ncbi:MAG: hypothetical protein ACM3US_12485 [Sphingomonadaceae bacterium]